MAAEAAFEAIDKHKEGKAINLTSYPENLKKSWVYDELHRVRNVRPSFQLGNLAGIQSIFLI